MKARGRDATAPRHRGIGGRAQGGYRGTAAWPEESPPHHHRHHPTPPPPPPPHPTTTTTPPPFPLVEARPLCSGRASGYDSRALHRRRLTSVPARSQAPAHRLRAARRRRARRRRGARARRRAAGGREAALAGGARHARGQRHRAERAVKRARAAAAAVAAAAQVARRARGLLMSGRRAAVRRCAPRAAWSLVDGGPRFPARVRTPLTGWSSEVRVAASVVETR